MPLRSGVLATARRRSPAGQDLNSVGRQQHHQLRLAILAVIADAPRRNRKVVCAYQGWFAQDLLGEIRSREVVAVAGGDHF